ncbi:MAG: 30S ribosomal protein S1 [Candidatus Heimdallarchaeota archaeon LC_2]|nr:MAG: 30S ribosomal protein S1 [Candidatus Heimdallarchaeota archaeon LC_2]
MEIAKIIASELNHNLDGIKRAISLFDDGNTLHFIARYRKDQTQGLEAEQLLLLQTRIQHLRKLGEARDKAIKKLQELDKISDVLLLALEEARSAHEVDEIMKPYRSKRKTKASIAREKGFQVIADIIMGKTKGDLKQTLNQIDGNKEEIIQDTLYIIAEEAINFPQCQRIAEEEILKTPVIIGYNLENDENGKYESLKHLSGQLTKLQPHQIQAIFRGQDEKTITLTIKPKLAIIKRKINDQKYFTPPKLHNELYQKALEDGINRLLLGRSRRATMSSLKEKADNRAIEVFKQNLQNLLIQAPIEASVIMAIDPGFRTGCKVAVVDKDAELLDVATIYPTPPKKDFSGSAKTLSKLISDHSVQFIALGNGTGSQESREFLKDHILSKFSVNFAIISESGASVYSASKSAQEEFPNLESATRGAISLARRILDPLGELVKIDPKSLGVGQYQHDVNQKTLEESLAFVVEKCINQIGVDVSTSSKEALQYISGLNSKIADRIIEYRKRIGLNNLNDILKISGIGQVTYDQAVGFLRLKHSEEMLDKTLIHKDHYHIATSIITLLGYNSDEWLKLKYSEKRKLVGGVKSEQFIANDVGSSIISDIKHELMNIGIDPRGVRKFTSFDEGINSIEDLKERKIIEGVIRNVVDFGAFVDLGIKENGLIHISNIVDRFISDIHTVVKVGDKVKVEVLNVNISKKRIGLKLIKLI